MPKADRHNEIELNLLPSGHIAYLRGGKKIWVETGRLCAFWAAIPHQVIAHQDVANYFVATVPLAWFLSWHPPTTLVRSLLRGDLLQEKCNRHATTDLMLFSRWVDDLQRPEEWRHRAVQPELQARLLRLFHDNHRASCPGQAIGFPTATIDAMATFIAEHYAQPIGIEDIGSAIGVHPNYAMTLFKKTFGMTILDYLTRLRLSHAQHLLTTSSMKILDVALSSGFSSISRFNAVFRSVCGITPREYRTRHRPHSSVITG